MGHAHVQPKSSGTITRSVSTLFVYRNFYAKHDKNDNINQEPLMIRMDERPLTVVMFICV